MRLSRKILWSSNTRRWKIRTDENIMPKTIKNRPLDPVLYEKICKAHEAVRDAHDYSYERPTTPFMVRISLGRAQSILIHYVVKYAGKTGK
jgi:hypothetical protein